MLFFCFDFLTILLLLLVVAIAILFLIFFERRISRKQHFYLLKIVVHALIRSLFFFFLRKYMVYSYTCPIFLVHLLIKSLEKDQINYVGIFILLTLLNFILFWQTLKLFFTFSFLWFEVKSEKNEIYAHVKML